MIKQCNAITTKNEYSLYRKSRENRAEKKKWIGKINKITKKPSRGSFVKQIVGTGLFNLTWKRRRLNVEYISSYM